MVRGSRFAAGAAPASRGCKPWLTLGSDQRERRLVRPLGSFSDGRNACAWQFAAHSRRRFRPLRWPPFFRRRRRRPRRQRSSLPLPRRRGARGGFVTPVYDSVPPQIPADIKGPNAILIFSKTNGYREEPAIQASNNALVSITKKRGWPSFVTENAAVMNAEQLARFKLVIWNNTSGDLLTEPQRAAFKTWMENGGSFVGTHGAGGDPHYDWPWYPETLIGAQFTSHSSQQPGTVKIEDTQQPDHQGPARGLAANGARRVVCVQGQPAEQARVPHSRGRRRVDLRSAALDDGRGSSDGVDALRREGPGVLFRDRALSGNLLGTESSRSCWKTPSRGLSASRARRGALRNNGEPHSLCRSPRARTGSRGAWRQYPVRARDPGVPQTAGRLPIEPSVTGSPFTRWRGATAHSTARPTS